MIQLNQYEKQWILLIKGHLRKKYPFKDRWVESLKPLFIEIYGWNPDENNNYHDYLQCIFCKLLEIQLKIKDNWSDPIGQLKEVFFASFYQGILTNNEDLPIERAIGKLCVLIQCTTVINSDNSKRFNLN